MTNTKTNMNTNNINIHTNKATPIYSTTYDLSTYSDFNVVRLHSKQLQPLPSPSPPPPLDLCFCFTDEFEGSSTSSATSDTVSIKSFSNEYTILKYNKDYLSYPMIDTYKMNQTQTQKQTQKQKQKYDTLGLFRSLVFYKDHLLSFAPPKSYDFNDLVQELNLYDKYQLQLQDKYTFHHDHDHDHDHDESTTTLKVKPFIDGTMINVFYNKYDTSNPGWKIATRSIMDAKTNFYHHNKSKSFHDMFYECLHHAQFDLDTLDKRFSYSFVMQHPQNRIVSPVYQPALHLCSVYEMENCRFVNDCNGESSMVTSYRIHSLDLEHETNTFISDLFKHSGIPIIRPIEVLSIDKTNSDSNSDSDSDSTSTSTSTSAYLSKLVSRLLTPDTPYSIQGYVFEFMGKRYKIINPSYRYVREQLRGNQAKLQFQFYYLRRQNRIQEYLSYFPEDTFYFQYLETQFNHFIGYVYRLYVDTFIRKVHSLNDNDMNTALKHQLHGIHKLYLEYLFPRYRKVTYHDVYLHITCMDPAQVMSSVNRI